MKNSITLIHIGVTATYDFEGFKAHLKELGRSEKTVSEYERCVKQYLAYLESQKESAPAAAWLRWDASSQQKRMTGYAIRAFEEFLREFYPDQIQSFGVPSRLPAATKPNPQPLVAPDQVMRVLNKTAKQILPRDSYLSLRVFITLLRKLALRRAEAAGITWNDIAWTEKAIVIRGKGDKIRKLPLSKKILKMLMILRVRSAAVLWIGGQGQVLNSKSLADLFKKVARAANLPNLKCHTFRATKLTEVGNARDFNPILYQAFSGHADLSTAKYYVRPDTERMREMLQQGK